MNIIIMGGIFIEKKFFRDWVEEYKQASNKSEFLENFIIFDKTNNRWKTKSTLLNNVLYQIISKYKNEIDEDECYSIALDYLYEFLENIDLKQKKDEFAPINSFRKNLDMILLKEEMKKNGYERTFDAKTKKQKCEQVISFIPLKYETDADEDEFFINEVDLQIFKEMNTGSSKKNKEMKFYETFKKHAKKILSPAQYEVFKAIVEAGNKTDTEIAKSMNKKKITFTHMKLTIINVIKDLWEKYQKLETDKTKTIINFLQEIHKIYEVQKMDFDYFGYLINFLKENYKKREQEVNFEWLQKNKPVVNETIFDVLCDRIPKPDYQILLNILEDKEVNISDGKKKEIFNNCIHGFMNHLRSISKDIEKMEEYLFKENIQKIAGEINEQKYYGVVKLPNGKYRVLYNNHGKIESGGIYDTALEAAKQYDKIARKLGKKKLNNV